MHDATRGGGHTCACVDAPVTAVGSVLKWLDCGNCATACRTPTCVPARSLHHTIPIMFMSAFRHAMTPVRAYLACVPNSNTKNTTRNPARGPDARRRVPVTSPYLAWHTCERRGSISSHSPVQRTEARGSGREGRGTRPRRCSWTPYGQMWPSAQWAWCSHTTGCCGRLWTWRRAAMHTRSIAAPT